MIYAIILAAGKGLRLKKSLPKALVNLNNSPIFLYSLKEFYINKKINKIFLVYHSEYKNEYSKFLAKNNLLEKVVLVPGSKVSRHKSLKDCIDKIKSNYSLKLNDILITHDAARVFINQKIINKNISICKKYGFASTVIPLSDSLIQFNKNIEYVDRKNKFLVQTPQTFKVYYWNLSNNKKNITDVFSFLDVKLTKKNLVTGSIVNYKITNNNDLVTINENWLIAKNK